MKIKLTKHSDTSIGRVKIGYEADLPDAEAKSLVDANKAVYINEQKKQRASKVVEEVVETIIEEADDAS